MSATTILLDPPFFPRQLEVGPVAVNAGPRVGGPTVGRAAAQEGGKPDQEPDWVDDSDAAGDVHCQDVGNVVLLEHINLEVPDLEVARLFFGEGLGLAADPGTTGAQRGGNHVVWYNCGRQQFHIARGRAAQRLPPGAVVGLVMPDVAAVAERLETVRQTLGDVSLTYARGDTLEAVDPYGNTFAVHSSLPYFPGRQGIAYLQLPCFVGTAAAIAQFYGSHLGARTRVSAAAGDREPAAEAVRGEVGSGGGGPVRAEVWIGPGQKLVFVEQARLGQVSEQAAMALFDGWHIAMYVADFSRTYRAVHYPDVPPFNDHPYRDHFHSLQDALRNRQFRFQDITAYSSDDSKLEDGALAGAATSAPPSKHQHQLQDQDQGGAAPLHRAADLQQHQSAGLASQAASEASRGDGSGGGGGHESGGRGGAAARPRLLYRISHEVRSMHHHLYGRPLYNREAGFT